MSTDHAPARTLDPTDALRGFERWVTRSRYAPGTQAAYLARTTAYLKWLQTTGTDHPDALVDEHARDAAVAAYRRHLIRDRRQAVATVELAVASLGAFYDYLGLGKPHTRRQRPEPTAPRTIPEDDLRRFLRELERRSLRDRAVVACMLHAGLRVTEVEMLDVDDLLIHDRLGSEVNVRWGKGDKQRRVELNAEALATLRPHRATRMRDLTGSDPVGAPLFVSRQGGRLSARQMQTLVTGVGRQVGLDVSPHDLRHTFGRRFIDAGGDLVALKGVLGHASTRTTEIYAQPTAQQRRAMVEGMAPIDY